MKRKCAVVVINNEDKMLLVKKDGKDNAMWFFPTDDNDIASLCKKTKYTYGIDISSCKKVEIDYPHIDYYYIFLDSTVKKTGGQWLTWQSIINISKNRKRGETWQTGEKRRLYDVLNEIFRWGFLRETNDEIKRSSSRSRFTKMHFTSLSDYLKILFPEKAWVHDKEIGTGVCPERPKLRPDYFCRELKMVVEFDGLPHYETPSKVREDYNNTKYYEEKGLKVVRIPFFIQLTLEAVRVLFGDGVYSGLVQRRLRLFPEGIPSISSKERISPACFPIAAAKRMIDEFNRFPKQRATNMLQLQDDDDEYLSGASMFKEDFPWPDQLINKH